MSEIERNTYESIMELHRALDEGNTTIRKVTERYLERIDELNGALNAVTVTNKQALEDADRLDALNRDQRGPLHGVPILIKDQIETAGIVTAYGSKACKDHVPTEDATLIRKLKEAGALILGKTVMPDWAASFFSTSSLSGETKHPIDLSRDPGGSSSGSATAVASNMALAAIGGDTGGSIRLPCSFCGLVGLRPTPGRVSRDGMSSLVTPLDTPGPMCKTVEDAAIIMDVIAGFDEKDPYTGINAQADRLDTSTPFTDGLQSARLKGRRLGVLRQVFGSHQGVLGVLNHTLPLLEQAGATLIDVELQELDHFREYFNPYILRGKKDINDFLQSRESLAHLSVESLHADGTYHKSLELFSAIAKGPTEPLASPHYGALLEEALRFRRVMSSTFAKHNLDAMIYPTCQQLPPKTQDLLDMTINSGFPTNTPIGSQMLSTAISVPIGKAKDDDHPDDPFLPVGLEILGLPLSERLVLNIAAGVEKVMREDASKRS